MKKSIFTLALALALTSQFASAAETHSISPIPSEISVGDLAAIDLNSFCKAIIMGDFEMVSKLISLGEDINEKSLGKTPAMYAARYNKAEILSLLIQKGANLSLKSDKENKTAEQFAAMSNAEKSLEVFKKTKE